MKIGIGIGIPMLSGGSGGSSGTFSPASISGLIAWYKAQNGLTKNGGGAPSDGDPVTSWADQSGNGNTVSQLTLAKMPTYKTAVQNGQPVLRFDGVSNYMQTAAFGPVAQPLTLYLAFKIYVPTNSPVFCDGVDASHRIFFGVNTPSWDFYAGNADTDGGPADTSWHVITLVANGLSSSVSIDRGTPVVVAAGSDAQGGITLATHYNLTGGYAQMDVGEILSYQGLHTSTQLSAVELYLKGIWGTP